MRSLRAAAIVVCALWLAVPAGPTAQTLKTTDLLDRYLRGEFDSVVGTLATFGTFKDLASDLEKDAPVWIDAAEPAMRARRQLAAATVALEASRLGQWREWKMTRASEPGTVLFWAPPARMLEWACELLRSTPKPVSGERDWQLASIAVAERAEDFEFLVGYTITPPKYFPGKLVDHAIHLRDRFPGEPRIGLALGIAEEWHDQRRAAQVFQQLSNDRDVGGEATMRLGALALRRNAAEDALARFAQVESKTRDPWVLYLARFFSGRAWELRKRPADAERAYRSALRAMPGSQSAAMALSSLMFRDGRRSDASVLTEGMLGQAPIDPWRGYADADDRFWPQLIARVRREIRP